MAQYKDYLPSQRTWIHELARAEIHPDAEKLLQLGHSFDPHQLVEESTVDFLTELRAQFEEYCKLFNSYAEGGARFQEVKIYSVTQTAADFMLFRNQVKLVVSNIAHGVIQFAFSNHSRGILSVDGQIHGMDQNQQSMGQPQDISAQIGPFREVYWAFQGERVKPEQVAKFYFAEFTRVTRDQKRNRSTNQALLEQIKSLLQEKGLDF